MHGNGLCCGWNVPDPDPDCCPKWKDRTPAEQQRAKRLAAFLLWSATGRQLGRCETSLRPCRRNRGDAWPPRCGGDSYLWARGWYAPMEGGTVAGWRGVGCGDRTGCSCGKVCQVDLPGVKPEPVEVLVHGREIPLDYFRVDNGRTLVWEQPCDTVCDGGHGCECGNSCAADSCPVSSCGLCSLDCFPDCQDLSKPPDCEGTWQVTYLHGIPVPEEGLWAAAELACELAKSCVGEKCRLPRNITSLTRNNVSMDFATSDVATAVGNLRFNLTNVDMFVHAVNPYGLVGPVAVYSPDVDHGRVQTWP